MVVSNKEEHKHNKLATIEKAEPKEAQELSRNI